jgi:hypothetical protein
VAQLAQHQLEFAVLTFDRGEEEAEERFDGAFKELMRKLRLEILV